jgi:hypothetical protein
MDMDARETERGEHRSYGSSREKIEVGRLLVFLKNEEIYTWIYEVGSSEPCEAEILNRCQYFDNEIYNRGTTFISMRFETKPYLMRASSTCIDGRTDT